jgi:hypothetical protein
MFNVNRHVLQIGVDDGYGSIHPNRYEVPKKVEKLVQLRYLESAGQWVHGERGMIVLSFRGGIPEPICKIGEVVTIKIRDFIIECKKSDTELYAILSIKSSDGALFNTLQVPHNDPLAKMIHAYQTVPIVSLYQ